MKKCLHSLLAAMLLLVSCNKDDIGVSSNEGYVDFKITTNLQKSTTPYCRASGQGGVTNAPAGHNLRYIMGVYDQQGENLIATYHQIVAAGTASVSFEVRLVADKYQFVFWSDFTTGATTSAQTEGGATATDNFYNTTDLKAIVLKGDYAGNNEAKDAYTASVAVDLASSVTQSILLKRPFGKLRLAATDIPNVNNYVPTAVTVSYADALPNTFNAVKQEPVAGAKTGTAPSYSYTLPEGQSWEDVSGLGKILAWDYLLPGSVDFTITTRNADGRTTTKEVSTVPVARNKLTTLKGGVVTNSANLSVTVEDIIGDGETVTLTEVASVSELQSALSSGATNIKLLAALDAPAEITLPLVSSSTGTVISMEIPANNQNVTVKEHASGAAAPAIDLNITDAGTLSIEAPNSTVSFAGSAANATASTAENTFIVKKGASISGTLTVIKGNVEIYGAVTEIAFEGGAGIVKTYATGDAATLNKALALIASNQCERIVLSADIDLQGSLSNRWTPINTDKTKFVEFDGAGHTISNLYVDNSDLATRPEPASNYYGGLFYVLQGTVKDLTIDKASVTCNRGGALVGRADYGLIENCHVKNATVKSYQKAGGLIGYVNASTAGDLTVRGCSVENCEVKTLVPAEGLYQAGGLIGYLQSFDRNVLIEGNSVSGISFDRVYEPAADVLDKVYDMEQSYSHAFIGTVANFSKTENAYDRYAIELRDNRVAGQVAGIPTCDRTDNYVGWWAGYYNGGMPYTPKLIVDGAVKDRWVELKRLVAQIAAGGDVIIWRNYDLSALDGAIEIAKPTTITLKSGIVQSSTKESTQLLNRSELTVKAETNATVNFTKRVVENLGTLTVEGGNYTTKTIGAGTLFWNNDPEAVMTLKNVNAVASNFAVAGGGEINIEGGYIRSTSTNLNGPNTWAYCVRAQDGGKMIIKNATIEGIQGAIACNGGSHILLENVKARAKNTPGRSDAFYALYAAWNGIIEVVSGEFYSDRTPCCLASNEDQPGTPNGGFILRGGKYSSKPYTNIPSMTEWSPAAGYSYRDITEQIDGLAYKYEVIAE